MKTRIPEILAWAVAAGSLHAQPIAQWTFDRDTPSVATETVSGKPAALNGNAAFAPGVRGQALVLDGLTTYAVLPATDAPKLAGAFTLAAWVAFGAYPLNWAPVFDLHDPERCGFFFGVDAHGRPGLALRTGQGWQALTATNVIPLRQWHHVAGVFNPAQGLSLFLDGQLAAHQSAEGHLVPAENLDLLIGRHRFKHKPEGAIRPDSNAEVLDFLDGLLDELKIFDRALSPAEIAQEFKAVSVPAEVPLPPRVLPAGPPGPGPFGAFYTRLKFHPQWDAPWRLGDFPDVVVRFDDAPYRFVFWHGTSFIPHWVTENGIWYDNEFNETWSGVRGCGEPMSDKQTRYSHVRVLESSEARAVVHWRYALGDVFYQIARTDPATGWGDWSDEVYTIYPDGTSVRDITLHSSNPEQPHEWQESIVVMGPGFSPENSIEPAGLTMVNAEGEAVTYSWEQSPPPKRPAKPAHPCIQVINTKSRYRPFTILRPQDNPGFDIYAGEMRRDVSLYPWWNHWPAAAFASDGRYAMAADRPSHSSLTHLLWSPYQQGHHWMRKIMLAGLTDQSATSLLPLVRSWSAPPALKLIGAGFTSEGYDQAQKAYVIQRNTADGRLGFELAASADSPLVNPAFVVLGWGEASAKLSVNGKEIPPGKDCRVGQRRTLDGTDLVLWTRTEAINPVQMSVEPK